MRTGRGTQPPGLEVVAVIRQRRRRVDVTRLIAVLRGAADALSVKGEVALVLAGDRVLRDLNHRYRGKDKPTDVLSFPGDEAGLESALLRIRTDLGDRVERARRPSLVPVLNATGVAIDNIPFTPERVWRALHPTSS